MPFCYFRAMRTLLPLILTITVCQLYGQHPQKIEQELLNQFKKIQYWARNNGPDSLATANSGFQALLLDYTAKSPATIRYEFKDLEKEGLIVRTSVDGLFRIYSWDTWTGGTAHNFSVVYQYKAGNKVFSKPAPVKEGEQGRMYSNLYMLRQEEKLWYVGIYHITYSTKDLYQGVKIFAIDKDGLNDNVKLIRTPTGVKNEMGFSYDFFSVMDRPERPVKLIYYDEDDKKIHLPVVLENGKVTKNFTVYQFTGEYFEKLNVR